MTPEENIELAIRMAVSNDPDHPAASILLSIADTLKEDVFMYGLDYLDVLREKP